MKESSQLLEALKLETENFKENKARLIEQAKEKANELVSQSQEDAEKSCQIFSYAIEE